MFIDLFLFDICLSIQSVNLDLFQAQSAGKGNGIHRLNLCRGVRLPTNECPVAQSAGAAEYTDRLPT